jgi:hypothetical protein
MYQVVLRDWIWAEGRGPELRRAHFAGIGLTLAALEYVNPDWRSDADIKHLIVRRAQVHMCTPEEVYNCARDEVQWGPSIDQAAVVNLGKSEWLLTFSQQHLERCDHYRIMFYDQYVDIICENISAENGPYRGAIEL